MAQNVGEVHQWSTDAQVMHRSYACMNKLAHDSFLGMQGNSLKVPKHY